MPQRTECDAQNAPRYGCYCATCRPLRKYGFVDRDAPEEVLALPPSSAKLLAPPAPQDDPRAIAARVEVETVVPPGHAYHPDQDYHYSGYGGW